jgi:hypothetical protein
VFSIGEGEAGLASSPDVRLGHSRPKRISLHALSTRREGDIAPMYPGITGLSGRSSAAPLNCYLLARSARES